MTITEQLKFRLESDQPLVINEIVLYNDIRLLMRSHLMLHEKLEEIMGVKAECPHSYFRIENGELSYWRCANCGEETDTI